jgi:GTPase SAR1 family protein
MGQCISNNQNEHISNFVEEKVFEKIKVVLLGDSGVGKTSFLKKITVINQKALTKKKEKIFETETSSTTEVDFVNKFLKKKKKEIEYGYKNENYKVQIFDTAGTKNNKKKGQERFVKKIYKKRKVFRETIIGEPKPLLYCLI